MGGNPGESKPRPLLRSKGLPAAPRQLLRHDHVVSTRQAVSQLEQARAPCRSEHAVSLRVSHYGVNPVVTSGAVAALVPISHRLRYDRV